MQELLFLKEAEIHDTKMYFKWNTVTARIVATRHSDEDTPVIWEGGYEESLASTIEKASEKVDYLIELIRRSSVHRNFIVQQND